MEISAEIASSVNNLLHTNSTPSSEQRKNLQNVILEIDEAILNTDEDISDINKQIAAMQTKILVIQTRRAQLIQQRSNYSSLLSPVRCLPIEIFGKIFVYATQDCARHVLNLSAVCQLWRDAALRTPMLWSTLELDHSTGKTSRARNAINYIDLWIERARSCPLSLVIKKDSKSLSSPVDIHVPSLIANHQWKSISLDSNSDTVLRILNRLKSSNLEMLESFSLKTSFCDKKLAVSDILRLGYTPNLKTLVLSMERSDIAFDMLPFPWSQLTSLTIFLWCHASNLIPDILQACVNLEEFISNGVTGSALKPSTTLNTLRKLHIHGSGDAFLLDLKTPSIQDFALKGSPFKYARNEIYDYLQRNGSTLLKLSIAPSCSRLVGCLPHLRSLVELKLYDNDYDGDGSLSMWEILKSLVVKPEMDPSAIFLPRLRVLEIICQATEKNQRTFMKVVNSRWWSDDEENRRQTEGQRSLSRIKYAVLMNVHTEMNMFCGKDVDVLRAQGMKIEYLAFFDGMDKDEFYTSRYYPYGDSDTDSDASSEI